MYPNPGRPYYPEQPHRQSNFRPFYRVPYSNPAFRGHPGPFPRGGPGPIFGPPYRNNSPFNYSHPNYNPQSLFNEEPPFDGDSPRPPFHGESPRPPFHGQPSRPPFYGQSSRRPFYGEPSRPPFYGEPPQTEYAYFDQPRQNEFIPRYFPRGNFRPNHMFSGRPRPPMPFNRPPIARPPKMKPKASKKPTTTTTTTTGVKPKPVPCLAENQIEDEISPETSECIITPEPLSENNSLQLSNLECTTPDNLNHNLREKLISQLRNGKYQCLVCISNIRQSDSVWSCAVCFHIYHLPCIKSWADKCQSGANAGSGGGGGHATGTSNSWRCPACQTKQDEKVTYTCFCGRRKNPEYHPARTSIPHGCDELCGQFRTKTRQPSIEPTTDYETQTLCRHPCTELCHPGPCPPCMLTVSMTCPCGRTQRSLACGDTPPGPCDELCDRPLQNTDSDLVERNCASGVHQCLFHCHIGPCPPCVWQLETACFCEHESRTMQCGSLEATSIDFTPEVLSLIESAAVEFRQSIRNTPSTPRTRVENQNSCENTPISSLAVNLATSMCLNSTPKATDNEDSISEVDEKLDEPQPPIVHLAPSFSCGRVCARQLTCTNHTCPNPCHRGVCEPCALDPSRCYTCPCGRVALSKLVSSGDPCGDRVSCTSPIPTCPHICARPHPVCGHPCEKPCHMDECPPCGLTISAKCRCGRTSKELTCIQYEQLVKTEDSYQMLCERKCKKKKVCGRHKCENKCCDITTHSCSALCGRRLTCQRHSCEEPCHPGTCGTCWRGVIYTEVFCRCGSTMLHPPQPCGSAGPECNHTCNREHGCEHPVRHPCHNDPTCPPCTVLLTKECPGGHGVQFSLPCFQPVLSCGRVCANPLPTCSHTCARVCHTGDCLVDATSGESNSSAIIKCIQPCEKPRSQCGHRCGLPCHEWRKVTCLQAAASFSRSPTSSNGINGGIPMGVLPPCRHRVRLVCPCGARRELQTCHQVQNRICLLGQQADSDEADALFKPLHSIQEPIKLLACDDTCTQATQEAEESKLSTNRYESSVSWVRGFDKDAPTTGSTSNSKIGETCTKTAFEPPEYSDYLRQYALTNFAFATGVEEQLYNMIMEIWRPTKPTDGDPIRVVSHHFAPMNKKRRRFIRELVEHYGIESFSFDPEPKRHVMVIAKRGEIRLPGGLTDNRASLTSCLQRDFTGTVHIREGIRVPKKPEPKRGLPPPSTLRTTYANLLK